MTERVEDADVACTWPIWTAQYGTGCSALQLVFGVVQQHKYPRLSAGIMQQHILTGAHAKLDVILNANK